MRFVFFNDTATTEIYTLSLHDALPIFRRHLGDAPLRVLDVGGGEGVHAAWLAADGHDVHLVDPVPAHVEQARSEEHTSELQSRQYLVCRLLLEKKQHVPYSLCAYTQTT